MVSMEMVNISSPSVDTAHTKKGCCYPEKSTLGHPMLLEAENRLSHLITHIDGVAVSIIFAAQFGTRYVPFKEVIVLIPPFRFVTLTRLCVGSSFCSNETMDAFGVILVADSNKF